MSSSSFRFKQFAVEQSGAAMKVGTDGVLLGAWARVEPEYVRYLDIGAGTGVIALMLAQRAQSCRHGVVGLEELRFRVDAVESDGSSALQAAANAAASPWSGAVRVFHTSIQEFAAAGGGVRLLPDAAHASARGHQYGRSHGAGWVSAGGGYDHIVSNPPWFVRALRCPDAGRSAARHADGLTYADLAGCVAALLAPRGVFSVILPSDSEGAFVAEAGRAGLVMQRRTEVRTLPDTPPKRVLLEFAAEAPVHGVVSDSLTIGCSTAAGDYMEEYKALTRDFYLHF